MRVGEPEQIIKVLDSMIATVQRVGVVPVRGRRGAVQPGERTTHPNFWRFNVQGYYFWIEVGFFSDGRGRDPDDSLVITLLGTTLIGGRLDTRAAFDREVRSTPFNYNQMLIQFQRLVGLGIEQVSAQQNEEAFAIVAKDWGQIPLAKKLHVKFKSSKRGISMHVDAPLTDREVDVMLAALRKSRGVKDPRAPRYSKAPRRKKPATRFDDRDIVGDSK